jgi:hypothetical protein
MIYKFAYGVIHRIYNTILRERLPLTLGSAAGVPVHYPRLLDATKNFPDYKRGLVQAIHNHCEDRSVTIIGMGRGVSTIHSLRAGATHVDGFEASKTMIGVARQTFAACPYQPTERITVNHNVVGEVVKMYGDGVGSVIPESELPANDVIIMDCEGAEQKILTDIPRDRSGDVAIVETHPERGVPTNETRTRLERLYETVCEREYMPKDNRGKRVLIGHA